MTPNAQKIAIAKACPNITFLRIGVPYWKHVFEPREEFDPLNDLNAMHEAEKTLKGHQISAYFSRLANDTYNPKLLHESTEAWQAHATAAQRAEAFLRTLNLWDDTR